jgi:hypothetical protein
MELNRGEEGMKKRWNDETQDRIRRRDRIWHKSELGSSAYKVLFLKNEIEKQGTSRPQRESRARESKAPALIIKRLIDCNQSLKIYLEIKVVLIS